jgi:hypothetical protein
MKTFVVISLLLLLIPATGRGLEEADVPTILAEVAVLADPGDRVVRLSAAFLGTPYVANTLVGGPGKPESLVSRLDAVDCFTLLDYVEALRRSSVSGEFRQRLIEVRYRDGRIAWEARRHFFTDWAAAPGGLLKDVTALVGGGQARQADKQLNRKADGTLYLTGVAVQPRTVSFVPTAAVDGSILDRLRSGDYLGIYTPAPGLDVSHVGIVVRANGRLLLRHASSRGAEQRVTDSDLGTYLAGRPGIVVLRPQMVSPP